MRTFIALLVIIQICMVLYLIGLEENIKILNIDLQDNMQGEMQATKHMLEVKKELRQCMEYAESKRVL